MITRLEISGFKSFTDFAVDFAPLTVIAGANASGKSNLLDALRLVRGLAQQGFFGPVVARSGSLDDLFTKYGVEDSADKIKIAVEIKLASTFLGPKFVLDYTDFRYEVEIAFHDNNEPFYYYEIDVERFYARDENSRLISMNLPDKNLLEKEESLYNQSTPNLATTSISEVNRADNIHLFACQQSLRNIISTDLIDPNNFSDYAPTRKIMEPEGVLANLIRYQISEPKKFQYLSRRVRRIIPELAAIDIYTDPFSRTTLTATDTDGRLFMMTSLSEGSLRIIALASYLLNSNSDRTLLLEEPENGIDPRVINEVMQLLVDLSTPVAGDKETTRQVICTTHSPLVLHAALNLPDRDQVTVLLANKVSYITTIDEKRYSLKTTRMNPIGDREEVERDGTPLERYTLREAVDYLSRLPADQIADDV
ncbi:MAG: AAA family ATPase [Saprospiraceae bacterium]